MTSTAAVDYSEIADLLSASPEHRVLKMFRPHESYGVVNDPLIGVLVDVESTGLNTDEDQIIQFGAVRFQYDQGGNVGRVLSTYDALHDPGVPLSPEIVAVTGLTDEKLRGHCIDAKWVETFIADADLIVAHNADFDRRMIERRFPGFDVLPWACSQRDVDWKQFDCHYVGLEYLLMKSCREFFLPHNALDDCLVGLHVLATPRAEERSPFSFLLESVAQPTLRLWAWQSPFSTKDRLRLRRFRWNGDRRCWWKDVKPAQLDAERTWLLENVYGSDPDFAQAASVTEIAAVDRYSVRADW